MQVFVHLQHSVKSRPQFYDEEVIMASINEFVREYVRAITEGYAAVFAGAGLSRGSGYTNWKELVRPLAEEIKLNVDIENDLVAVVQYYANERGNRYAINEKILNEFTRDTEPNKNIEILTRLPIQTYWTTNYDELLETSIIDNNRKVDIKTTQKSLGINIYDRDAVVYKMHGDVRAPSEAVLTKDDYEIYGNQRPLFRTALQGDLISKTFLFIGFSFEDPNLDYILSRIRVLLGESLRDHFCFFEKTTQKEDENDIDYGYRLAKQDLRIKDLKRYGIQGIILDSYEEITKILAKIEQSYLLRNVFVSGSVEQYAEPWTAELINQFTHLLAKRLVKDDFRIISGFGLGIGSTVINGALDEIMISKYKHVDEHLCLRPFPQLSTGKIPIQQLWQKYREEMISQAGVVIFIFGNKKMDNLIEIADGMIEEFKIAQEMGKFIIPIGSTGGASAEILRLVKEDIDKYPYLRDHIKNLESENNIDKLLQLVITIIKSLQID